MGRAEWCCPDCNHFCRVVGDLDFEYDSAFCSGCGSDKNALIPRWRKGTESVPAKVGGE